MPAIFCGMTLRSQALVRITFDRKDDSIIYVSTFGGSVWRGPAE